MTLVIVSNRLPVVVRQAPDGLAVAESVGGVATGLRGIQETSHGVWIGWPGPTEHLSQELGVELDRRLEVMRCVPVRLTRSEVRGFYQGYSNAVIWPLFHYLIQQTPLHQRHWQEYDDVNRRFAEVAAAHCASGDQVWIHDYQLMRVPLFLRRLRPDVRIGFFLHIPFPSFEVFRILPSRQLLLEGLLAADLIGFHTASYAEHFTRAVSRLLGTPVLGEGRLEHQGRTPRVGVFPMGIAMARFEEADAAGGSGGGGEPASSALQTLLAIDRLDYTKGIPRRLLAFEELLRRHPELHERVTLTQVAVPSRTGVRAYQRFRRHVDAMVGRINGRFGSAGWTPVQYLYRGFAQSELVALYRRADVMLVTPVRDGMNLVAKEFVASRVDGDGVLVLSEFAGAAAELVEAVQVNPYDIEETAAAYYRALSMPRQERRDRMRALRGRVRANPISHWAASFLGALQDTAGSPSVPLVAPSTPEEIAQALTRARQAPSLVLILDYDGTLVPFAPIPELAIPDDELVVLLQALASRPATQVHLVSGRQPEILEAWFGHLPVGLKAEHGLWSRLPGGTQWERGQGVRPVPSDEIMSLLERFTEMTPGARIERKSGGLAWHFRLAAADVGSRNARALVEEAGRQFLPELVDILRGEKVVEFRPAGVHKGLVVSQLLESAAPGTLVVVIGDDATDEDMFAALGERGLSLHVGPRPSLARLRLQDMSACRAFLRGMLEPGASV